jgi:hypothetical protein
MKHSVYFMLIALLPKRAFIYEILLFIFYFSFIYGHALLTKSIINETLLPIFYFSFIYGHALLTKQFLPIDTYEKQFHAYLRQNITKRFFFLF